MTTFTKMFTICTEPIYRLPTCNIAGHFLACIEGVTGEGLGETKTHLVSLVLSLQDTLKHFSVEAVSYYFLREFDRKSVRSLTTEGLNGGVTFRSSRFFQLMRSKNL